MDKNTATRIAARFILLPQEKRREYFKRMLEEGISLASLPIPPVAAQFSSVPLSYAQQRQWFLWQLDPFGSAYNIPLALQLSGALDLQALQSAFDTLIERHESLRTTFHQDGEQPVQVVHSAMQLNVALEEVCIEENEDDALRGERVRRLIEAETQVPFDLTAGPLVRARLLRLAPDEHILVLTQHHIISDGWSVQLMANELSSLYFSHSRGQEIALPELPIQYRDYAVWQRHWMEAGEMERQLAYWRQQLGGLKNTLELPADHLRPPVRSQSGARLDIPFPPHLAAALKKLCRQQNTTVFIVLLSAFHTLLYRYSGQKDIRVGIPVANRKRVETEGLIGLFVNTLVHQATLDGRMSFLEVLQQVRQTSLASQAYQDLPFEQLVETLQPDRSPSHTPLFQVMLNHQTEQGEAPEAARDRALTIMPLDNGSCHAHFDLTLNTVECAEEITASIIYATDLFLPETIERLASHWIDILVEVTHDPASTISELPLTDKHLAQNEPGSYPTDRCIQRLIEAQAKNNPNAIALVFSDRYLTYRELNERANSLAHKLIALGVHPDTLVGVCIGRGLDIVISLLAVLKAGGAFIPLDPSYPADRLSYMIRDGGMDLLLMQEGGRGVLDIPESVRTLLVEPYSDWPHGQRSDNPCTAIQPDNLAYVIYTSGSTGKPKGVAVSHGPLAMHCLAIADLYEMDEQTRELHFMSFSFDGAQERWLSTLASGGRLIIRDEELWAPEQCWQALLEHEVTIACFPPAYLQQLAEYAGQQEIALQPATYCFGGDAVPEATFELVKRTLNPSHLVNGYGPTETVITPLLWRADIQTTCAATYAPIGHAVGNRRLYVLDEDMALLPRNVAGELYIGGDGLARGYLGKPGLTAERFVADPFSPVGGRLYRTGDLVKRRPDGTVDYLGRLDNQVKIRGFRIELGEIEAIMRQQPGVREAVASVHEGPTGKQLIGYVVTSDNAPSCEALRNELKRHLPDYMVPTQILALDNLPLSPNGKLSRKDLPTPPARLSQYVPPRTSRERNLATIWQQVLGIDPVGMNDNFFELGGSSMDALKVISMAKSQGLSISLSDLMRMPSIAELSQHSGVLHVSAAEPLALNRQITSAPILFCFHGGFGTVFDYRPLAQRLEGRCSVYGIPCRTLLDPDWRDVSLESMAADYAAAILKQQPTGPYRLLGWSLGGVLAVLTARELEKQGSPLAFVGLVDSFLPDSLADAEGYEWQEDLLTFVEQAFGKTPQLTDSVWRAGVPGMKELVPILEAMKAATTVDSFYSTLSSQELAMCFLAHTHLKKLSLNLQSLPTIHSPLSCWWAGKAEAVSYFRKGGYVLDHEAHIDAQHFDILRQADFMEQLNFALAGS